MLRAPDLDLVPIFIKNVFQIAAGYTAIYFDTAHFMPNQFDIYQIDCPPNIKKAHRKRQAAFFFGRLCARAVLTQQHSAYKSVQLTSTPQGYVQWPLGFVGSISHTKNTAVAVVGPTQYLRGIGIDCESIMPDTQANKLKDYILQPQELSVASPIILSLAELVTLAFCAKESLYKATYPITHIFLNFQDTALEKIDLVQQYAIVKLYKQAAIDSLQQDFFRVNFAFGNFSLVTGLELSHQS